jgi:hypothetical protein
MSTYELNRFCHRLSRDADLRDRCRHDLPDALTGFDLTAPERQAVVDGDVAWLYERGVHPLLLVRLQHWSVAGLTEAVYSERIRRAAGPPAEGGTP